MFATLVPHQPPTPSPTPAEHLQSARRPRPNPHSLDWRFLYLSRFTSWPGNHPHPAPARAPRHQQSSSSSGKNWCARSPWCVPSHITHYLPRTRAGSSAGIPLGTYLTRAQGMEQVLQNMNRLNRNLESIITVRPPNHKPEPQTRTKICRWATNSAPSRRYGRNSRTSWVVGTRLRRGSGRAARARSRGMRGHRMKTRASRWGASSFFLIRVWIRFGLDLDLGLIWSDGVGVGWILDTSCIDSPLYLERIILYYT